MSRRLQTTLSLVLIALGLSVNYFPDTLWPKTDLFTVIYVLLEIGAMVGPVWLLSIFIRSRDSKMQATEVAGWEQTRLNGRSRYIKKFVLTASLPVLLFMGFVGYGHFLSTGFSTGSVVAFLIFLSLVFGVVILVADRFWQKNEFDHEHLTRHLPR